MHNNHHIPLSFLGLDNVGTERSCHLLPYWETLNSVVFSYPNLLLLVNGVYVFM